VGAAHNVPKIVPVEVQVVGGVGYLTYRVLGQHILQDLARCHVAEGIRERAVAEIDDV
jgi:hypothetical protein